MACDFGLLGFPGGATEGGLTNVAKNDVGII